MHKLFILLLMAGCTGMPEGVTAIKDFDMKRYLGTWHEIARLDHRFERGLEEISATYSLRDDGGINVVNQGLDSESGKWNTAEGKGYFIDKQDEGRLKVSFFGPFYGSYNIIALDKKNYSYAMIAGPDKDYLWILARQADLAPETLKALIEQAKGLGFDTNKLIYPKHVTHHS